MSADIELSDTVHTVLGRRVLKAFNELPSNKEYRVIEPMEPRHDSKSPAIAYSDRGSLSIYRELCDVCLEPPVDEDGYDNYRGVHTLMNADKRDDLRDMAEIALKFYNETKLKNFKLVKVCKINVGLPFFWLTFRAREDGSEEYVLFRGGVVVVCGVGEKEAVFCEIKDDDEVTLLPDDVQSKGSIDSEDSPRFIRDDVELSDTEHTILGRQDIKSFNDLPSYIEYRVIEPMEPRDDSKSPAIAYSHRRSLSSLRKFCDVCLEPPGDEAYRGAYTLTNVDKQDDLRDMAEIALKFYNETKLKNFKLVKVCKVNAGCPYFCLTFTAQEDGSEEYVLFRGGVVVVSMLGEEEPVFCEIKDDDEVTLLPHDADDVQWEGSIDSEDSPRFIRDDIELSDTEHTVLGRRVLKAFNELPSDTDYRVIEPMEPRDDSKSPAIAYSDRGSLSIYRELCDVCLEPPVDEDGYDNYRGVHTLMNADKRDDLRDMAEIALKFYNETKLKNFKLVKVFKINVGLPFFWLTFRAREDGSEEYVLFRGGVVVCGVGEKEALFCEIKDDDEVTLLPDDADDVQSEGSIDSEDSPRFIRDDVELSDTEHTVLGRQNIKSFNDLPSYIEYRVIEPMEPLDDSKSPAIAYSHRRSLSSLRKFCDVCLEPPGDEEYRGAYTLTNVDKQDDLRDMAEIALKFYNETKLKNFKLVKVCKVNAGCPYFCLTFTAQEDGSEECVLFRGGVVVVSLLGEEEPVFCEIKDDDEVRLLPGDADNVQLEGSCDSEDSSPCK